MKRITENENGANLSHPLQRHREAPFGECSKPRRSARAWAGLQFENSRFSAKTVAELRKMFWLSVSGRVFVSDALVLTPTLYFNKRSLLSDSTFDSVARPA